MHGVQVVAGRQQHVVHFSHEHGFHKRRHGWNGFALEEDELKLELDVIGLLETSVVSVVRLQNRMAQQGRAVLPGKAGAQFILQRSLALFQLCVVRRIGCVAQHEHACMRLRVR